MKVEVNVDERLVESALQLSGLGTQNEVIEQALKSFVQLLRQENIKALRGNLLWEGDLGEMRSDEA